MPSSRLHQEPGASGAAGSLPAGRGATVAGLLLLALYVLPLYAPPPPEPLHLITTRTPLMERLFPGVPAWWIVLRLLALAAGALLLAAAAVPRALGALGGETASAAASGAPRAVLAAGLAAALISPLAWQLPHALQLAYAIALPLLPAAAAMLHAARHPDADEAKPAAPLPLATATAAPLLLAAVWLMLRVPPMYGSFLLADAIDYLTSYSCFATTAAPDFAPLSQGCWPGYTNGPLALHGFGLLGAYGIPLTMGAVQTVAAVWTAAAGAMLAWLVGRLRDPFVGLLAGAVFLWSPIVLVRQYIAGQATYTTFTLLLLLMGYLLWRRRSAPAAAAFGALLGLATHLPNLVLIVPLLGGTALWRFRRSATLVAIGLLFFVAGIVPGSSQFATMFRMAISQAAASTAYAPLEGYFLGRVSPSLGDTGSQTSRDSQSDILLGLIASPVAVARSPMRLWGDVVVEPIGAALAMVGLAAAVANARRQAQARMLLALTVAAMLPGVASSYDRAIPIRIELMVPIVLLAVYGWCTLAHRLRARPALAAAAAVLVAASGTWVFDHVHARILSPSAAGLAARAGSAIGHALPWSAGVLATRPDAETILGREILGRPAPTWQPGRDRVADVVSAAPGIWWTPGEQMDRQISHEVCRHPDLVLYEVSALHGETRLFAALRKDFAPPADSEARWTPKGCEAPLSTDAGVAAAALTRARDHAAAGARDLAIDTLQQAAVATLVQPRLYLPLATLLAQRGADGDLEEALFWAGLSCNTTDGSDYQSCVLAGEVRSRLSSPPKPAAE